MSETGRLPAAGEPTTAPSSEKLSVDEDDELRRLYYLSQVGNLSPWSKERMLELRFRDRRFMIRRPREMENKPSEPKVPSGDGDSRWKKFISRRG